MQGTPYRTPAAAKRLRRNIAGRAVAFEPIRPVRALLELAERAELAAIYVVGPAPEAWHAWSLEGVIEAGWEPGASYLEGATPILRYQHRASGRRLEVHHAAAWFPGRQNYTATDAAAAWELVAGELARAFAGATMLATPSTTGRECFLRTIPAGREWPVLDSDSQEFLRQTLGQARIEGPDTLLAGAPDELPGLYEYDGRLMYAALCWGLPTGAPKRDTVDAFEEYAPGRYLVDVRVPTDWPHPFGCLGVWHPEARKWRYPRQPGERFATWADGAELRVALAAGYELERVRERFLFERVTTKGPLDVWARKMVEIRGRLGGYYSRAGDWSPAVELGRRAVRHMILTTIGAFQGRPHKVTRSVPIDTDDGTVPISRARLEGEWITWSDQTEARWSGLAHPEWCATVWARARARLLSGPRNVGALHLAPGSRVVAFRTDAIYTDRRQAWADDGAAGRFRLVAALEEPVATPRSSAEVLDIRGRLMETIEGR